MTRILARTLATAALFALAITLVGCDGGTDNTTGPQGQAPRDPNDRPKIEAPGGEPGETVSTTGTQQPR